MKGQTYTSDGGGYSPNNYQRHAKRNANSGSNHYPQRREWVSRLTPTYQTEKSLASRPQTNQINNRRGLSYNNEKKGVDNFARKTQTRQYTPEIDSKRTRTYWKSSNGDSGVKRTPVKRKGRWTEE